MSNHREQAEAYVLIADAEERYLAAKAKRLEDPDAWKAEKNRPDGYPALRSYFRSFKPRRQVVATAGHAVAPGAANEVGA